jgi:hypothetical protein
MMSRPATLEILHNVDLTLVRRVDAIKALRFITKLGLKETKDIIDKACIETAIAISSTEISQDELNGYCSHIRKAGFHVKVIDDRYEIYIDQLKEIAVTATLKGDYYVATQLTQFLSDHF